MAGAARHAGPQARAGHADASSGAASASDRPPTDYLSHPWSPDEPARITPAERQRAIALLEAVAFLRTAHYRDGLTVQEIGAALLHTADDADPMAASLFRDGNGPDEIAAMLAAVEPAVQSPADRAAEELAKHFAQAIWALKSPPPPGSEHYRSGWDDGLEAAIDAARDVLLRRLAGEQPTNSEARPDDTIHACPGRWGGPSCRCFDKEQPTNSEARDAPDQVVAYVLAERVDLHCPRCAPTPTGDVWTPVTAEELEDGGICTVCGRDVLIPAPSV